MSSKLPAILGVECGATSSTAVVLFQDGSHKTFKFGPANFVLLTREQLGKFISHLLDSITASGVVVSKVGIAMAGILNEANKQVILKKIGRFLYHKAGYP